MVTEKLFPRKNPYHGDRGGIDTGALLKDTDRCPECFSSRYIETLSFRKCDCCGFFRDLWARTLDSADKYKNHPELLKLVSPSPWKSLLKEIQCIFMSKKKKDS